MPDKTLDVLSSSIIETLSSAIDSFGCASLVVCGGESPYKYVKAFGVDFVAHASSMGATAEKVANAAELKEAFKRAKASEKTYVIVMDVDPYEGWTTEGHTWWEVGTPHVSNNEKIDKAHKEWESSRKRQRRGV